MFLLKTTFTLSSSLTKSELISRITQLCKTTQSHLLENEYNGFINDSHFELSRIINGRNSFKPIIKGNLESLNNGTTVHFVFQVPKAIQIFMGLWYGMCVISFLLWILENTTQFENPISLLEILGMLAFGFFLSKYGFEKEVKNSMKDMQLLLEIKD